MKKIFLTIKLICLSCFFSYGQQSGSVTFSGVHFTIPEGWVGNPVDEGYMMGSYTVPGFIMVYVMSNTGVEQIKQQMVNGIHDGYAFNLMIEGPIEEDGNNVLGGTFTGVIGKDQVRVYILAMAMSNNHGFVVISGTTVTQYNEVYRNLAHRVVKSARAPENANAGKNIATGQNEWTQFYANTKLTYMDSYYSGGQAGGGYSDEWAINLCANGHFSMHSNFEMSGGGSAGTFIGTNRYNGSGNWDIEPVNNQLATLVLTFSDGTVQKWNMAYEDGKTYIDKKRFYRTTANDGSGYAPQCP
jgi:hypothetical protein